MTDESWDVAEEITCLECGDVARLISFPDEDGHYRPGDVVVYSCRSCFHRWDIVLPSSEGAE